MKKSFALLMLFLTINFCQADDAPIKIAVLTDLSGSGAFYGQQTRNGALLAEKELQAKGVNIQILLGDHRMDTKIAIAEAQRMLDMEKASVIFSEFAGPSVAISSAIKNRPVIHLYSAAAFSPLTDNPQAFKTFIDFGQGCGILLNNFLAKGYKNIGFIGRHNESAELCGQKLKELYPNVQIIENGESPDLATEVLKFKQAGIEAIISVNYEHEFVNILKILRNYDYHPALGSMGDIITGKTRKEFADDLKNTQVFSLKAANNLFLEKLLRNYPESDPVTANAAALAYLHIMQLSKILPQCKNDLKCQMEQLSATPADLNFGYLGFKNRTAEFEIVVKPVQ